MMAKMEADREESKAERKTDREEMVAKMEADREESKAERKAVEKNCW
jgi:hypothetical protein